MNSFGFMRGGRLGRVSQPHRHGAGCPGRPQFRTRRKKCAARAAARGVWAPNQIKYSQNISDQKYSAKNS